MISPPEFRAGLSFAITVPRFLSRRISPELALRVISQRLERREADFLQLVGRAVYGNSASPYLRLLQRAGCERGDLGRLVAQEGLEGALSTLRRSGVYLTVGEFKGRQPIVRGSFKLSLKTDDLRNPAAADHLAGRSSGSRGSGTVYRISLDFIRERSYNKALQLAARQAFSWRAAYWGVPGGSAIGQLLQYSVCGLPPVRWFSQVDPATEGLHARYRWSVRLLRLGALGAGMHLPAPEHVSLDDPMPIVRWMRETLDRGETPFLYTFASCAVRVCRTAHQAGIELPGAQFALGGEPTTAARLATIKRVGATGVPNYAIAEAGRVGHGCLDPAAPDDMHLLRDLVALIQAGEQESSVDLPPRALLVSSLRETTPLVLLNVSLGDEAELFERRCGCPFERYGWTSHLQRIRSFEKLTAGGMTFQDTDVIRVLEDELPARFGGGPNDYQLVEEDEPDGVPSLKLRVHPDVAPADEQLFAEAFLEGIGRGSGTERLMALQWRESRVLHVVREVPRTTANGKILHLRQESRLP